MNLVNIMLPNFNSEQYLQRAINSIKNQDMQNFVCNIVDDCSTDNSVSIILENIKNDSRFNLICLGKNGNVANARNIAANIVPSKYLAALDSDDEWLPNHLSLRLQLMENYDYDYLYGKMKIIGDEYVIDKNNPSKFLHIHELSQGATIFIKTEKFKELGGYKNMYGEDGDLLERAFQIGLKIKKVDFETYIYHRNPHSITSIMAKGKN